MPIYNIQCCQNHISIKQTLSKPQNGLFFEGFLVQSRPLADQIEPFLDQSGRPMFIRFENSSPR